MPVPITTLRTTLATALVDNTKYLQQQGYEFQINYDLRFDQPIFTTNFAGSWVNA